MKMGTVLHYIEKTHIMCICAALILLMQPSMTSQSSLTPQQTYRAAAYEHTRVPTNSSVPLKQWVHQNMLVFQEITKEAALQNTDIIVFPEYGLGTAPTRDTLLEMLEELPNPRRITFNPCKDLTDPDEKPIQYGFSCMAFNNSMYVVGNMGEVAYCDTSTDPHCPEDGRYQYNTNIVLDPQGDLIAKYNKKRLNYEPAYDEPIETQFITFNTPFGKFGVFTCFDVLFYDPAIVLVEQYGVTSIVFPTAWNSALPLMYTLGIHEAWAVRNGVNFISAELHNPRYWFTGSGLYSGAEGAIAQFHNFNETISGHLLIHDLPIVAKKSPEGHIDPPLPQTPGQQTFTSLLQNDPFLFVMLDHLKKHARIQYEDVICNLDYAITNNTQEVFALGAFEGLHTSSHNSYIQVCTLVKCASSHPLSCGKAVTASDTLITFQLRGQFETPYIYPQVVFDGLVVDKETWTATFSDHDDDLQFALLDGTKVSKGLIAGALYGRIYERDTNMSSILLPLNLLFVAFLTLLVSVWVV